RRAWRKLRPPAARLQEAVPRFFTRPWNDVKNTLCYGPQNNEVPIMMFSRLGLAAILAGMSGCLIPGPAAAQYPAQPIKLIVPFSAGGTTDLTARILAARMSADLGQQMVVENIEGAGGTIGTEAVARARPDGYTLILH